MCAIAQILFTRVVTIALCTYLLAQKEVEERKEQGEVEVE